MNTGSCALWLAVVCTLAGCADAACPSGSASIEGRCVAVDPDSSAHDAGQARVDAGTRDAATRDVSEGPDAGVALDAHMAGDAPRTVMVSLPEWVTVHPGQTATLEGQIVGDATDAALAGRLPLSGITLSFGSIATDGSFTLRVSAESAAAVGAEGILEVEVSGPGLLTDTHAIHTSVVGDPGERVPSFEPTFVGAVPPEQAGGSLGCVLEDGSIFMVVSTYDRDSIPIRHRYLTAVLAPTGAVAGPRDFPWSVVDVRLTNPVLGNVLSVSCFPGDRILATTFTFPEGPSTEGLSSLVLLDRSGASGTALSFARTPTDCAMPAMVDGDFAYWGCNQTLHRLRLPALTHDSEYGIDGQVSIAPSGRLVGIDAEGRPLILVNQTQLSRLLGDGSVDVSFGMGGRTVEITPPFGYATYIDAAYYTRTVFVEPESGAITAIAREGSLTGGPETDGFNLIRYLPSGLLDPRFGAGGIARHPQELVGIDGWLRDGDLVGWIASATEPPAREAGRVRFAPDGSERVGFYPTEPPFTDFISDRILLDERRGRLHRLGRVGAYPPTTFMVRSFWL